MNVELKYWISNEIKKSERALETAIRNLDYTKERVERLKEIWQEIIDN